MPEDLDALVRGHVLSAFQKWRDEPTPEALRQYALACFANGLQSDAAGALAHLVDETPDDPLPAFYLALARLEGGDAARALAALDRVVERWPAFAPAHERRGWLQLNAGELAAAEESFRRAAELAPGEAAGFVGFAESLLQHRLPEEALLVLDRAPPGADRLPQVAAQRSRALRALGRAGELPAGPPGPPAIVHLPDEWSGAVEAHVRDLSRLLSRATTLVQRGQMDAAAALLIEVLSAHQDNFEAAVNLAVVHRRAGRPAKARDVLEPLVATHPDRFEAHLNLAAVELDLGDLEAALSAADRAVELAPSVAQAHRTRAKVLRRLDRPVDALTAFERAVEHTPGDVLVQVETAKAALAAGANARAEGACRRVIDLIPESITGPLCLGESLRRQGRLKAARTALEEARRLQPDHPDVAGLAARLGDNG